MDRRKRGHVVEKRRKRRTNLKGLVKNRIFFLLLLATCLFCILIGRLFYVQVVWSDDLTRRALKEMTKTVNISSDRGLILDRNGKKMAVNISSSDIFLDRKAYERKGTFDGEAWNKAVKALSETLNLNPKTIEEITEKKSPGRIARDVDRTTGLKVRDLNLPGVTIEDKFKRFYPYNNLAGHVIGFIGEDGKGLYGVEAYYNDQLAGLSGKIIGVRDKGNRTLPVADEVNYAPKEGLNIALSIDETVQRIVEDTAAKTKEEMAADKVTVIVQDCNSGEILAMANKDDYNLNLPRDPQTTEQKEKWDTLTEEEKVNLWYSNWRNFSVNDLYEPGSTFKTITAAAALEEGTSTPDEHFYCTGYVRDVPGGPIKCSDAHGDITMTEGYAVSCNTTFVKIGRKLGREKLLKYIRGFGFGEKTGIDLPGEEEGIIPKSADSIRELKLATMSYGHGIAVTPIQLINAVSAVANGGNLMVPRVVHQIVDDEGNPVKVFEPKVRRQVISKKTSEEMLKMMEAVVDRGTGTRARIAGYRFGGKTGTANMVSPKGGYEEDKYVSSFVGVAPINAPKYTILVIAVNPEKDYYGGAVAAPAASEAMGKILSYEGVPKTEKTEGKTYKAKVEVPDVTNLLLADAGKKLVDAGLKFNAESTGLSDFTLVTDQSPQPGAEVDAGTIVDLYLNPNNSNSKTMPILSGKTKEEVKTILKPLDVEIQMEGEGLVIEQSPKPGEVISWKKPVILKFAPPLHEKRNKEESSPEEKGSDQIGEKEEFDGKDDEKSKKKVKDNRERTSDKNSERKGNEREGNSGEND